MTLEVRLIDDIKDALKQVQMNMHPYLRDYSDYSVLNVVNEAAAIQIQFVEQAAKDAIESVSVLTATGSSLDNLVSDRGIEREDGTQATGYLTFRCSMPALVDIDIPVGTLCSAISSDGNKLYFQTTSAGQIAVGFTSDVVDASAVLTGTDGNVPAYSIGTIETFISGISKVENLAAFSGGTEEESDDDLRDRYKYATDVNGKATLPILEQHIYDLDTVRECQIYQGAIGEIEVIADSTLGTGTIDTDITDLLYDEKAVGIVSSGKLLASIESGILTPLISVTEGGLLFVRLESTYVASAETISLYYTDTLGISRVATVDIPASSTKGDTISAVMSSTDSRAVEVTGFSYVGSSSYSVLCGMGTYPYLYILPRKVLANVQVSIVQTDTPSTTLSDDIESSLYDFLDSFLIGDTLEFSDLIQYIYRDYNTGDAFVGIDQITSVVITADGESITSFGQSIDLDDDQRIDPGTITISLS